MNGNAPRDIGIDVSLPAGPCTDKKCPFHGGLKVHGRTFVGALMKDIFHKTAVIQFERLVPLRKYERTEKRRSRLKAHAPACMSLKKGDMVRIMETKPISKTKTFVVIEVIKQ